MSGKYDDIIDLPHPEPQTHPRMPMRDRAAQFAPFAALTGHRAALAETERRAADAAEPENGSRSRSLRRRACIQGRSMFGRSGGNTGAIAPRQNVRRRSSHPAAQCH